MNKVESTDQRQLTLLRSTAGSNPSTMSEGNNSIFKCISVQTENNHKVIDKEDKCSSPILGFLACSKRTQQHMNQTELQKTTCKKIHNDFVQTAHSHLYGVAVRMVKATNLPRSNLGICSCVGAVYFSSAQEFRSQVVHSIAGPTFFDDKSHLLKVYDRSQLLSIKVILWYPDGKESLLGSAKRAVLEIVEQLNLPEKSSRQLGDGPECTFSLTDSNGRLIYGEFGVASITARFSVVSNSDYAKMNEVSAPLSHNADDARESYCKIERQAAAMRLQGFARMFLAPKQKDCAKGKQTLCNQYTKLGTFAADELDFRNNIILVGCQQTFIEVMKRRLGAKSMTADSSIEELMAYLALDPNPHSRALSRKLGLELGSCAGEDGSSNMLDLHQGDRTNPRSYLEGGKEGHDLTKGEGSMTETNKAAGANQRPEGAHEDAHQEPIIRAPINHEGPHQEQPISSRADSRYGTGQPPSPDKGTAGTGQPPSGATISPRAARTRGHEPPSEAIVAAEGLDAVEIASMHRDCASRLCAFPLVTVSSRPSSPLVCLQPAPAALARPVPAARILVEPPWIPATHLVLTAAPARIASRACPAASAPAETARTSPLYSSSRCPCVEAASTGAALRAAADKGRSSQATLLPGEGALLPSAAPRAAAKEPSSLAQVLLRAHRAVRELDRREPPARPALADVPSSCHSLALFTSSSSSSRPNLLALFCSLGRLLTHSLARPGLKGVTPSV